MDLGWSNFPLQGLYLPFVHEVLTYLIQPPLRERSYLTGQMIDLSPFMSERNDLVVIEPDGNQLSLQAASPFYRARMPGLVQAGEQVIAVNIAPEASALTRIDVANLTDRILNPETAPVVSEQVRAAQLVAEIEQPQRLWWWIVLLVMALFLIETWIANRTYR
jgi:hypothetical protein